MLQGTSQGLGSDPSANVPAADVLPGFVWRADGAGRLLYANPARLAFTGSLAPHGESMGWIAKIHPADGGRCVAAYRRALSEHQGFAVEYRLRRHDGAWRWIIDRAVPARGTDGRFAGHVGSGMDIHEHHLAQEALRRALEERRLLAAELQHRVRNTVQMIASVLTFQARRAAGVDTVKLLMRTARRVRAMGLAQEKLFARFDPTNRIDLGAYLGELARDQILAAERPGISVLDRLEAMPVRTNLAATLGFMVSELVANALQHAFASKDGGTIKLCLRRQGEYGQIVIEDDGIGLPVDIAPQRDPGVVGAALPRMGMTLLAGLARQAKATIAVRRGHGTRFVIIFPLD